MNKTMKLAGILVAGMTAMAAFGGAAQADSVGDGEYSALVTTYAGHEGGITSSTMTGLSSKGVCVGMALTSVLATQYKSAKSTAACFYKNGIVSNYVCTKADGCTKLVFKKK